MIAHDAATQLSKVQTPKTPFLFDHLLAIANGSAMAMQRSADKYHNHGESQAHVASSVDKFAW